MNKLLDSKTTMWVLIAVWLLLLVFMIGRNYMPSSQAEKDAAESAETAELQAQISELTEQIDCYQSIGNQQREWAKKFCVSTKANPLSDVLVAQCIEAKANSPEAPKFECKKEPKSATSTP